MRFENWKDAWDSFMPRSTGNRYKDVQIVTRSYSRKFRFVSLAARRDVLLCGILNY